MIEPIRTLEDLIQAALIVGEDGGYAPDELRDFEWARIEQFLACYRIVPVESFDVETPRDQQE